MAVFSVVKLSELEGAKQLAPEFYHPDKIVSKRYLENAGTKMIKDCFYNVREIFDPKKKHLNQQAIVYDLSDITSYFLFNGKKVSSSEEIGSAKKIFLKNDVLISRLRPYLKEVSFIGFNEKLKLASTEFVVLRQKNKNYYPETLFAYLISKEVQNILVWSITGTEHPRFNEDYFLRLTLPDFSDKAQKKIKTIVQSAWEIFLDSLELYSQAENLLLEELGLKDFKPQYKKTYTAKLSDAFSAHRIDAEYFQPAYEEVLSTVSKRTNLVPLKKLFDFRRGIFIPTDFYTRQKTNRPYIRIKELTGKIGIDESKVIYIKDDYPEDENNKLYENDFVIAIIGDTIGKTNRIPKELAGGFCSNNTGRLRIKSEIKEKIIPEFAEILFQSLVIQSQITRKKAQTGQPKISDKEIKSIEIPLLPLSTQQKIASLVQQSHEARKKAKELLEVAKRAVEIAIENGEDEAIKFISTNQIKP